MIAMTSNVRHLLAGLALALAASQGALAAIPIQHWSLANGAKVYLVESHAIPMVDVEVDFDGGARRDPPGKAGLAAVSARMTSKGIAAGDGPAMDENQLSEAWADLGGSFGGGAGADRMSFSMRSLTYPDLLPKAVQLAARQLGEPSFPEPVWLRDRERLSASIREANTRPATVAGHAFASAVYGNHPYGAEVTEASLAQIGVADMRDYYRAHVEPCRAKISVVGDVTRSQAEALVDRLLARLPQRAAAACQPLPAVPDVAPLTQARVEAIPFHSAQAHVLIGQPGYKRDDPDFFPLTVGNYILGGGGFVSRLTSEVREKRGLSYSVYSYFSPGLHAGAFTVGMQTRPDQTAQAVTVSREVLERFVREGPTEAELKAAKDNLIGGFALRIDSNRKLLDNVANIAWNNLPLDYLDTWTRQVERVTVADIKAAFHRKLQPDRMVVVTVGATDPAVRQ
ncbi:M16 family metallopeptidase [Caenimonas terrae]|uniref:M16 family metallopeptidase n=1 Tax=Caenimonas terrae TaxID=696074 RepID=A0ABW0N5Q3_9BURK